ncbi:glycoside hydrolase family 1 protein [Enorma massiliensis]|uniref:glycoside hydrolase family 1 protein n=1 Tax=Enorma massiliensis TaxID=1472761 RepID=UPI0034A2DF05
MSDFMWGSATAAYQCEGAWNEGDKGMSNWDVFCHSEKNNVNPVTGDVSCDHYHHFEEDLDMMAAGNQNAYRFSIAWTRIIPNGVGEVSEQGVAYYNRVIDACLARGIEPLVTLYHYDMPNVLFEQGGWENRANAEAFAEYAKVCFERFGDRVKWWATINEPTYDTLCCYANGNYPPNVQDLDRKWRAMYHQLLGSALAVRAYREGGYPGKIGLVSDSYSIETLVDNDEYREAARRADLFYNRSVNDVCVLGEVPQDFVELLREEGYDLSYALPGDAEIFRAGTVDYLGVNAYSRELVKPAGPGETMFHASNTGKKGDKVVTRVKGWFELDSDDSVPKNDWDMELYPKSIYNLLLELHRLYPNTPFVITENGIGYYDTFEDGKIHDPYRVEFLAGFVEWMQRAQKEGVDVRGYFVWSTMDLYSWINGYKKRYGLVYVDYDDDNRRYPKDSYYWYRDMIAQQNQKEE